MAGFGRKGLAPGEMVQPAQPIFGGEVDEHAKLRAANRQAGSAISDGDAMAAKRAAFLAAERQRKFEAEAGYGVQQRGISDYAEGFRSSPRSTNPRSLFLAYVLWFFVGQFSAHRFYLGATASAWYQLGLFVVSLVLIFVFAPIGMIGFVVWALWLLADAFLMPGLHRKLCSGDPSPIFS